MSLPSNSDSNKKQEKKIKVACMYVDVDGKSYITNRSSSLTVENQALANKLHYKQQRSKSNCVFSTPNLQELNSKCKTAISIDKLDEAKKKSPNKIASKYRNLLNLLNISKATPVKCFSKTCSPNSKLNVNHLSNIKSASNSPSSCQKQPNHPPQSSSRFTKTLLLLTNQLFNSILSLSRRSKSEKNLFNNFECSNPNNPNTKPTFLNEFKHLNRTKSQSSIEDALENEDTLNEQLIITLTHNKQSDNLNEIDKLNSDSQSMIYDNKKNFCPYCKRYLAKAKSFIDKTKIDLNEHKNLLSNTKNIIDNSSSNEDETDFEDKENNLNQNNNLNLNCLTINDERKQSSSSVESSSMISVLNNKVLDFFQFYDNENTDRMDVQSWLTIGDQMVKYIANYIETIGKRRVTPDIEPGYLKKILPKEAPFDCENWSSIMYDFQKCILPGITHWQHPRFHAYFPAGNSFPSILADMLSDAIGCIGFSWAASPACTELETIMLDWVGKMINLPSKFLCDFKDSKGGGVIQSSASECVLICLLAARYAAIKELKKMYPNSSDGSLLDKLIGYCSKEAHSCVEKAARIGLVKLRILEPDDKFSLRGDTLKRAMEADIKDGLVPFFVSTTLGTTSCCSFDCIEEIGPICQKYNVYLHVDAAYAGNSFICEEFQHLMKGIEYANSFNMNPNKFMLVNFDCSLLWVNDRFKLTEALVVDPLYLKHSYSEKAIDYRHWGIPLSRRFRSLKLWFVIRKYGINGLKKYVRKHCELAKKFEELIRKDDRFEIVNEILLGLVCFRLKDSNTLNEKLLSLINASGKLHMVPASLNGKFVIRFCVCSENATINDIQYACKTISQFATDLYEIQRMDKEQKQIFTGEIPNAISNDATSENIVSNLDESIIEERKDQFPVDETVQNSDNGLGSVDEVIMLHSNRKRSLRLKRTTFVRMVSDPKLYNPKIVKALNSSQSAPNKTQNIQPNNDSDIIVNPLP